MKSRDAVGRVGPLAERLLENQYAQENLRTGVESLRAAYRRATKRRASPTEDKKLHAQLRRGAASILEGARALKSGRQEPERHRGRVVLVIVAVAAAGAGAAVASSEEMRRRLFGGSFDGGGSGSPEPAEVAT
ncbi:MAG TPA: hypothetical protein VH391_08715 [Solirubrobacterales bacterium]|jgi:hypothetical protein